VGCGGGLVSEPLARLGFQVMGIDASEENIIIAKQHAKNSKIKINYAVGSPEETQFNRMFFDVVIALEIIEHASNIELLIENLGSKVKPGGIIIFSTINRTYKSFLMAKIIAEYILRWVPSGTHTWQQFVKPSEIFNILRKQDFELVSISGFVLNIKTGEWETSSDISNNYILSAKKI